MIDPWRDAPVVRHLELYEDWVTKGGGTWPQVQFESRRDELLAWFDDAPLWAEADASFRELASPMGLFRAAGPDVRRYPEVEPASDELIHRVAVDIDAAAGDRTDRVLGPWFEELDPSEPGHRRAVFMATALRLFTANGPELSVFHQWGHRKPRPTPLLREQVRRVGLAPMTLWGLEEQVGDRWRVRDLVGLWPHWTPDEPVSLLDPGQVAGPPQPGDTLAGRLVPARGGWQAHTHFVIPGRPSAAAIERWVALEMAEMRLYNQRLTLEALLRARGHRLALRAHAVAWHNLAHVPG